jgi:hypothetical protein
MKIAVIGSRTFNDYSLLKEKLDEISKSIQITEIISGGAKGADSLAEKYAREKGLLTHIIKPDWEKFGKSAGFRRNQDIINESDFCLAFWDGQSKGTLHSIELAKKKGIPVTIQQFDQH